MIFRWYGYFLSGKSTSHCTANLFSKELHKQALRGEVELLKVSCQCILHNCNCYGDTGVLILYVANNEHQSHIICFIYSFIHSYFNPRHDQNIGAGTFAYLPSSDMLFCHTITPLSHIILDASHHTHLWWMFLSCSVRGCRFMLLSDWWNVVVASGHWSSCLNNNTIVAWK